MRYPDWHPRYAPPPRPEPSVAHDDAGYPGCALVFAVASFVLLAVIVWLLWTGARI